MGDDLQGESYTCGREVPTKFCKENVKRKDSEGDTGVDAKSILEWVL
jgi:hypothetical protein